MNLAGRGIDNFPCASHIGKNGFGASETHIIPMGGMAVHRPALCAAHQSHGLAPALPLPEMLNIEMLNTDQHIFQHISHEEVCWFCRCVARGAGPARARGPPWPDPTAAISWLLASLGQAGRPAVRSRPRLLRQDVGFASQVFPEFVKNLSFFFLLAVVCGGFLCKKLICPSLPPWDHAVQEGGEKK